MNITINGDVYIVNGDGAQEEFESQPIESEVYFEFDENFLNACANNKNGNVGIPDELVGEFVEYIELLERSGNANEEKIYELINLIDSCENSLEDTTCVDCIHEELIDMLHGFLDIIN